jgi:methyl-accepting chemotaxis protein
MAAFTLFTDRVLPAIQEPLLALDGRAANCRNRRPFNDPTGLAAGRSTAPFLLQTYRRDMGAASLCC